MSIDLTKSQDFARWEALESMKRTVRLSYIIAMLFTIGATAGYLHLLPISCLLALYAYLLGKTHSRAIAIAGLMILVVVFGVAFINTVIDMFSNPPTAGTIALTLIPWLLPLLLLISAAQTVRATSRRHALERTTAP